MKQLLFSFLTATLFTACIEQLPPAETFSEAADPTPLTEEQAAAWEKVKGISATWATTDSLYSRSIVPQVKPTQKLRLSGWRNETISAQILLWTADAADGVRIEVAPLKNGNHTIVAKKPMVESHFVRYTLADKKDPNCSCNRKADHPSVLVPDMLDTLSHFDMAARTVRPVWLKLKFPLDAKAGIYRSTVTIVTNSGARIKLPFEVELTDRSLKQPEEWSYHLDLWQHPTAVARAEGLELWSDEHFEAIKRNCKLLQQAGQKVITTTLNKDPWNHQCYDPYQNMIKWTLRSDGSWHYDYTIFDKVVASMQEIGIKDQINCYSMVPWGYELEYFDEKKGEKVTVVAKPGTPIFEQMWAPFLTDFARHIDEDLQAKGRVNIAMDERNPTDMDAALVVLRKYAPDLGFAMADNKYSYKKYTDMNDVCVAQRQMVDPADLTMRREKGFITTFYVSCSSHFPNTFTFSQPYEAELLGWYAAAHDFDGMLRWAYNSWSENPQYDSRFDRFASGDTFLIYPYARSSIRFERMIDGIEAVEKLRSLSEAGVTNPELEEALERIRNTKINNIKEPWQQILTQSREALEKASRE